MASDILKGNLLTGPGRWGGVVVSKGLPQPLVVRVPDSGSDSDSNWSKKESTPALTPTRESEPAIFDCCVSSINLIASESVACHDLPDCWHHGYISCPNLVDYSARICWQ